MSWPAASFALVALALGGGFVWYERTRPSSRMLALVGTLAALAALGRIAFAPLPDVKPTTAIVVISGYALGGAPGFAIGAIAALSSNMFYGQGPWTPWQMLGWGLAGLIGAALARVSGRRLGRWPLALACGAAAIVFNLLADISLWVTYTGDLSWSRFGLIEAAGLWFNVTHVVASVVFFLIFGPTLIRMLERFRARLQVSWIAPTAAAPLVIALIAVLAAAAVPIAPAHAAAQAAHPARSLAAELHYLRAAQQPDGGFGPGPHGSSSQLYTAWVTIGLAAAGDDPKAVRRGGHSPVDYIRTHIGDLSGTGDLERTILALASAGASPRRLDGRDLVAELLREQQSNGSFAGQANLTAFAILALRASGIDRSSKPVSTAGAWLAQQQNDDGSFSFAVRGGSGDVDDTAAAIEGLVAAGAGRGGPVGRAVRFVIARQNLDGGFPLSPGDDSNAQSSAWAVQALVAARRDPARVHRHGSRDPLAYLATLVAPDGSVRYSRTSAQTPVWVTAQALAALVRKPLPVRPPAARHATSSATTGGPSTVSRPHRNQSTRRARAAAPAPAPIRAKVAAAAQRWAREAGALIALLSDIGAPPPAGIG